MSETPATSAPAPALTEAQREALFAYRDAAYAADHALDRLIAAGAALRETLGDDHPLVAGWLEERDCVLETSSTASELHREARRALAEVAG